MKSTLSDLAPLMRELLHQPPQEPSLEELSSYIRHTLPQAKVLTELKLNKEAAVVTFAWKGHRFLVKKSFEVFELKGKTIFITGASQLMQSVLKNKEKNKKVVSTAADMLQEAEALLRNSKTSDALKLLQPLKRSLAHLVGTSSNQPKPRAASVNHESAFACLP